MAIPKPPTNATSQELAAWLSSESVRRAIGSSFKVNVTDVGTYVLTNVPPGTYHLRIAADMWLPDAPNARDGLIEEIVVVPETIDAAGAAFIVPDMHIALLGNVEIGDYIPSVDFTTLDGKRLPLSVFTNKVILLDFWASWCAPCIASIPRLKSLWEEFGNDDRFTLLSVSLDRTADDAKRVVKRFGLDWPQACLGNQQQQQIPSMLGFVEVPTLFVLSPGGRVAAKENDVASLRQDVD
jgi:thiol-disulfide isomerase/thioredoxin